VRRSLLALGVSTLVDPDFASLVVAAYENAGGGVSQVVA